MIESWISRLVKITMVMLMLVSGLLGCANHAGLQTKALCYRTCEQKMKVCSHECDNNCQQCARFSILEAKKRDDLYQRQQQLQGKPVVRELKSYRDPLQCQKTTCECSVDYRVCVQSCSNKQYIATPPVCAVAPDKLFI